MSLYETPTGLRTRISFFGKRNAGKSSLVNAITGQNIALVSAVAGTTTDPVNKSMELFPIGPVVITDTAGFDDFGTLGELRIKKTMEIVNKTDIAIIVADASKGITPEENNFIDILKKQSIPHIVIYNKSDLLDTIPEDSEKEIYASAANGYNIEKIKELLGKMKPKTNALKMVGDFINKGDTVIFVTPIDESAPKGRLILPQQQAIRDTLDSNCTAIVAQVEQLADTLKNMVVAPKLVVTDSQVFRKVAETIPQNIPLTSFSILVARTKGLLDSAVLGAAKLDELIDGDKILISEGCTHHRQCNDIGTVKLPKMISNYTKSNISFDFSSGNSFPDDLSAYKLIVHCGGCMISEKEMSYRVQCAKSQNVPITNYGTAIAHMNGILKRSLEILPHLFEKI